MSTSVIALIATIAIWSTPFIAFAVWLIHDRRQQRRLRRDALAALDAEPGTFTEVRPHLYVAAEPRCQVVSLDAHRQRRVGGAA